MTHEQNNTTNEHGLHHIAEIIPLCIAQMLQRNTERTNTTHHHLTTSSRH